MEFSVRGIPFSIDDKLPPFFCSKSGSDAYGWETKDSGVDIREVWIPTLKQALSIKYSGRTHSNIFVSVKVQHGKRRNVSGVIDFTSYPIKKFLILLTKGSVNQLENTFQEKIYVDNQSLLSELQDLVITNIHVGYLKAYRNYAKHMSKDCYNQSRLTKCGLAKLLLMRYRLLKSGIILAENKEVVYNIHKQQEYLKSKHLMDVLTHYRSRYRFDNKIEPLNTNALSEIIELEQLLDNHIKHHEKVTVHSLGLYTVFDNFLYSLYK